MKLKLAIILGISSWLTSFLLTELFSPIITSNIIPQVNIIIPIIIITVTGFYGILYIRNIDSNEVIEGISAGIVFSLCDIICDYVFFVQTNYYPLLIENFAMHALTMTILTILITTLLGYLAQIDIELT